MKVNDFTKNRIWAKSSTLKLRCFFVKVSSSYYIQFDDPLVVQLFVFFCGTQGVVGA